MTLSFNIGVPLCNFWTVMDVLCCTASILHLAAIAVDRYWAVTRADYSRRNNKKIIFGMIFFAWFLSICISLPSRFTITDYNRLIDDVLNRGICMVNNSKIYAVFSTAGAFFVPMTFLLCIYIKIYMSARERIRKRKWRWLEYLPSNTNTITNYESIVGIKQSTAFSGLFQSTTKLHADGLAPDVTKQAHSIEPNCYNYNDKDACLLSSSTPRESDGDADIDVTGDRNIIMQRDSLYPRPTDESTIQSPFLPQSPPPTPHHALDYSRLAYSSHSLILLPPLPPPPDSPPPKSSSPPPPSPLSLPQLTSFSTISRQNENGFVMSGHLSTDSKCERAFNASISLVSTSVKKQLMKKQSSVAAVETVLIRREQLENRRERRAARTLAIITGFFLLCWIPFSVNALVEPLCGEICALPPAGEKFFLWLGYLNSLLNPIIYTIFSSDYRKAFIKTLSCRYCHLRR